MRNLFRNNIMPESSSDSVSLSSEGLAVYKENLGPKSLIPFSEVSHPITQAGQSGDYKIAILS
jgi:hypothetical protein